MSKSENIEKLFKETFDQFEADVNPVVWSAVQKNISSGTISAGKFSIGKIIGSVGLIFVGIAGTSLWHLFSDKKQEFISNKPSIPSEISSEKIVPEPLKDNTESISSNKHITDKKEQANKQVTTSSEKENSSVIFENNISVEERAVEDAKDVTANTNKAVETNNSSEQNNPPMPGFAGLMRGNKPYNVSSQKPEHYSQPIANIFSNTTSGDAPLTVEFINNGSASSLNWNFGDGIYSNESTPLHTFTKAGVYIVTLTAKTSLGSTNDKVTIEVKQVSEILNAPNIFTPNEDGENDAFYFEMKNIESIGVVIFSPKQGVVYDWNAVDGNWNGKFKNGIDAPEGTYFYTVQAIGSDGISHSKKGSVFLKRH